MVIVVVNLRIIWRLLMFGGLMTLAIALLGLMAMGLDHIAGFFR